MSLENLFRNDFMMNQSSRLAVIKDLVPTYEIDIEVSKYYHLQVQTPSAAVYYKTFTPATPSTLFCPEVNSDQGALTLQPEGSGHLEEIFMDVVATVVGAGATPCELWPYLWFTRYEMKYGENLSIFNQVDTAFLFGYMFSKMRDNTREQVLKKANNTTPWVVGVPSAHQVMIMPTPWSLLLNATGNAPLPLKALRSKLTITFNSRSYKDWLTAYTPGTTQVSMNMTFVGKMVTFVNSSASEPGVGHSDNWICGFENPLIKDKTGYTFDGVNPKDISPLNLDSRKLKQLYFFFRSAADYPQPTVATVGNRFFFRGGRPNVVEYHPNGDVIVNCLTNQFLIDMTQLSCWTDQDWYNGITSTVTNAWANNYAWTYGPHYSVADLMGTYEYNESDKTNFTITYPVAGLLIIVGIAYQIIKFVPTNPTAPDGYFHIVPAYNFSTRA